MKKGQKINSAPPECAAPNVQGGAAEQGAAGACCSAVAGGVEMPHGIAEREPLAALDGPDRRGRDEAPEPPGNGAGANCGARRRRRTGAPPGSWAEIGFHGAVPHLLKSAEAAKYLRISMRKLSKDVKARRIPVVKYGGRNFFRREALDRFIRRMEVGSIFGD